MKKKAISWLAGLIGLALTSFAFAFHGPPTTANSDGYGTFSSVTADNTGYMPEGGTPLGKTSIIRSEADPIVPLEEAPSGNGKSVNANAPTIVPGHCYDNAVAGNPVMMNSERFGSGSKAGSPEVTRSTIVGDMTTAIKARTATA